MSTNDSMARKPKVISLADEEGVKLGRGTEARCFNTRCSMIKKSGYSYAGRYYRCWGKTAAGENSHA
jgi:hypothetical protein